MLFNSLHFLFFLPFVICVYFNLPSRFRQIFLLAASYYFYMAWRPEFVLLLLFSTAVDYFCGIAIENAVSPLRKKLFLTLSCVVNLSLLGMFKYYFFLSTNVNHVFGIFHGAHLLPEFRLVLPIGISFYTFQTLGYSIDVYRGRMKAERDLCRFALYVTFFPQLVAGPIERAGNLIPQLGQIKRFDYERMKSGLFLIGMGFFKKLVIADRAAVLVNRVYNNAHDFSGMPLLIATYFFAFQIYCDFSGYSDIARGTGRVLGIELMRNFQQPYLARSVIEFWRRWHISLSTWFRDYIYYPIGGNRVTAPRHAFNILLVFMVSGLWHGANWTFLVWGAIHGITFLMCYYLAKLFDRARGLARPVSYAVDTVMLFVTFNIVCLGWVFFRANSLRDAWYIITHLFHDFSLNLSGYGMGLGKKEMFIVLAAIGVMMAIENQAGRARRFVRNSPLPVRWTLYYLGILTVLIFGKIESNIEFIYFQF